MLHCRRLAPLQRALLISSIVTLSACTPDEGDRCTTGIADCQGASQALWCVDGVMTRVRCAGPQGCRSNGLRVECDQSVGQVGDVCVGDDGGSACSADGLHFLQCAGGRMAQQAVCRGPAGCHREGTTILCDQSVAQPGDACTGDGQACAPGGRQLLGCEGGQLVVLQPTDSCTTEGGIVRWIRAQGSAGDPCTGSTSACSGDGEMLVCDGGRLRVDMRCRGPQGCYVDGDMVRCDQSIAAVGERCNGTGAACSEDASKGLRCEDGAFVLAMRCPAGCRVEASQIFCE